jgi:hypothetical protein
MAIFRGKVFNTIGCTGACGRVASSQRVGGKLIGCRIPTHIPHGRLVHFLDFCGNPENKAVSTDEQPWCRSEPRMLNRMQRRAAGTTALVSWRQRQLANEALNSDLSSRIAVKTARMANAKYPKSATGHAECGPREDNARAGAWHGERGKCPACSVFGGQRVARYGEQCERWVIPGPMRVPLSRADENERPAGCRRHVVRLPGLFSEETTVSWWRCALRHSRAGGRAGRTEVRRPYSND